MTKLLDSNGLSKVWSKIKANFLSIKGGIVTQIGVQSSYSESFAGETITRTKQLELTGTGFKITNLYTGKSHNIILEGFDTSYDNNSEILIKGSNIISTSMLLDKSVTSGKIADAAKSEIIKPITDARGAANGYASLDDNGKVPLDQLGNLDTSLFVVVTSLPSSGQKTNKIYIVKDGNDANDVYQEYYYTGSAWEKIGTHAVKVDLTPYAKRNEAVKSIEFSRNYTDESGNTSTATSARKLVYTLVDETKKIISVPVASASSARSPGNEGFMSASDKAKLDGIAEGANNYSLPTASASVKGGITLGFSTSGKNYAVQLDSNGNAYVNVPWTDTHVSVDSSLSSTSTNPVQNKVVQSQFSTISTTLSTINTSISNLNYSVLTNAEIDAILV